MTSTELTAPLASASATRPVWDGVIPLERIFAHTRPAYGGDSWEDAIAQLLAWPAEKETVDRLVATADADGLFDEPVAIGYDEEEDRWYVGNGMHRIAATHLTGRTRIRCTSDRNAGSDDSAEVVEMHVVVTADTWPDGEVDDMDYVVKWMRSFQLPDGTWVEMFGGGCFSGVMTFSWFCPQDRADALVGTLHARAARHQVTLVLSDVTRTTIGELLADD